MAFRSKSQIYGRGIMSMMRWLGEGGGRGEDGGDIGGKEGKEGGKKQHKLRIA